MTFEEIKKSIENTEYDFYGIRTDGILYNVGDIANNSRQCFQDPEYDEYGELIYPRIVEGPNAGLYDAGELPGTSTIGFEPDSDESILNALEVIKHYPGEYIHILGGYSGEDGNDRGEIIISNARVLGAYEN